MKLGGDVGKLISKFNEIVKENNSEVTMLIVGTIPHSASLRSHVIRTWRPFLDKTP